MKKHLIRILFTAPAPLWAFFILFLLMIPGSSFASFPVIDIGIPEDKAVHAFLFFVQALLVWIAFPPSDGGSTRHAGRAAFIATVAFGALTELLQLLTADRTASVFDLFADAAGAGIFLLLSTLRPLRAVSDAITRARSLPHGTPNTRSRTITPPSSDDR